MRQKHSTETNIITCNMLQRADVMYYILGRDKPTQVRLKINR